MKNMKILQNIALISQIGISMLVPIFGCIWLGHFLDTKLHTSPWLLLLFIFIGIFSAFRNLFLLTKKQSEKKKEEENEGEDGEN